MSRNHDEKEGVIYSETVIEIVLFAHTYTHISRLYVNLNTDAILTEVYSQTQICFCHTRMKNGRTRGQKVAHKRKNNDLVNNVKM